MKNLGFDEEDIWNTNIKNEDENETISVSSSESDESDDIDDITKEHNFIRNNVSNKSFDSTLFQKVVVLYFLIQDNLLFYINNCR